MPPIFSIPPSVNSPGMMYAEVNFRKFSFAELFIASKRSPKTRTTYPYSINMLLEFLDKPLQAATLEDAVNYHEMFKNKYESLHSIKLHMDVAKSLELFPFKQPR